MNRGCLNISNIVLRPAQENDAEFLFNLRNDQFVRKSAFRDTVIDWNNHQIWLKTKINDEKVLIFIAEKDGAKIGQVRFECNEEGIEGEVDIAIDANFRGQGFGETLLVNGSKLLFQQKPKLLRLIAYIKESNIPSVHSFLNAGFNDLQKVFMFNQHCVKLTLKRKDK